jgi:hypothetical protein
LFSCKQDGGEKVFTPEDVKNPATAEGIDPKVAETMPIITFDKLTYDLGRVVQGEKLTYSFKFTNTGKSDLIISNVELLAIVLLLLHLKHLSNQESRARLR